MLEKLITPPAPPQPPAGPAEGDRSSPVPGPQFDPLEHLLITDGAMRTLFDEYAQHRATARGEEEIGWLLLGLRGPREAVALATLPAGSRRDAGASHVQFDSTAQAVACRAVRQRDRRLAPIGVVHTHPGSLRHPSEGDLAGDSQWVGRLRGHEGVFGIGTADVPPELGGDVYAVQPRPNVSCLGELRLSWYALRKGEGAYRPLPVQLTLGPDLGADLRPAWATLEAHAPRLERLAIQQAQMRIDILSEEAGPGLLLRFPLADGRRLGVVLRGEDRARFLLEDDGETSEVESLDSDERVDRGVYLLLAEMAAAD